MSSAAEIIARIRNWSTSQDTAVLTNTELLAIMNDVAREAVDENDIWFCFGSGTTRVTSGDRTASLPDRLVRPVTVFADNDTTRTYYNPLSYEEFSSLYFAWAGNISEEYIESGDTEGGTPVPAPPPSPTPSVSQTSSRHYTIFGPEMWFGPTPTATATVTVEGLYYPEDLVLNTRPTNLFTEHAESFLLFATLERLTKFKFEEETRLGLFEQEKKKALNRIRAHGDLQENLARRVKSRRRG